MSDIHGSVHWTELMTRDLDAAVKYYGDVCGWTFQTMPMGDGSGDYHLGLRGETPTAGLMDMSSMAHLDGVPAHWFTYFAVDDLDKAVEETRNAGGKVLREPFEVPGIGRIAILEDPTGAAMGMMTPAPRQEMA